MVGRGGEGELEGEGGGEEEEREEVGEWCEVRHGNGGGRERAEMGK